MMRGMYGINNSAYALSGLKHIAEYKNRALPYSFANALSGLIQFTKHRHKAIARVFSGTPEG